MLSTRRGAETPRFDEAGSGTAIAVAIVFPMLMLTIVVLQATTASARVDQKLRATAGATIESTSAVVTANLAFLLGGSWWIQFG